MKIQFTHTFEDIISLENLLLAWQEFIRGKKSKPDAELFSRELMDHIIALHESLANKTYRHGGYESFYNIFFVREKFLPPHPTLIFLARSKNEQAGGGIRFPSSQRRGQGRCAKANVFKNSRET
jgi:hypothetical protein